MPDKTPFDDLFEQFNKLLHFIEEHSDTPIDQMKIPEDMEERLASLQKKVDAFDKVGTDIVNLSGVNKEEIQMRLQGVSDQVPEDGKELINKSHLVKRKAEILEDHIEAVQKRGAHEDEKVRAPDAEQRPDRDLTQKQQSKKRRSKFKRFGGDDKWKPL